MIKVTLHGPNIDGWTLNFHDTPIVGDTVHLDGRKYKVIRREWREATNMVILHLTLELA